MVTCCSPASSDREETLNSLKYAARAIAVKNHIVANETSSEGGGMFGGGAGFEVFRDELASLKSKLAASEELLQEKDALLQESHVSVMSLQAEVDMLKLGISEIREEHQVYMYCIVLYWYASIQHMISRLKVYTLFHLPLNFN
jgi:hypothetical protein